MSGQRVHLYAACWNEIDMLDFFFRHYDPWVERYVLFDDGSTDGSRERLADHPRVELHALRRTHPDSLILSLLDLYNQAWKRSRGQADWVAVVNVDEHLHHPAVDGYLAKCRRAGVTAIPTRGYEMVADDVPDRSATLVASVRRGAPSGPMSKLAIFDADAIDEINYAPGRHSAEPTGRVALPDRHELLNLHFKHLGLERTLERRAEQRPRLSARDRSRQWGHEYDEGRTATAAWLAELRSRAVDPFDEDAERVHAVALLAERTEERDRARQELEERTEERDHALSVLADCTQDRDRAREAYDERNRELGQRNRELAQRDQELGERDRELGERDRQLAQRDHELEHANSRVEALTAERDELAQDLEAVRSTRAWRLATRWRRLRAGLRRGSGG